MRKGSGAGFAEARKLLREALGWAGDEPDETGDEKRLRSSIGSLDVILLTEYLSFEAHRYPASTYAAHLADVAWAAGIGDAHFVDLRANIAEQHKRPEDAARYRKEGEGRFPSSIPVFRLQRANLEKSDVAKTLIFRETIDQGRADAAIFQEYALLEKGRGQLGLARTLFEQGILGDPTDARLYQAYGVLEEEQGRYEQARDLFEGGIEADQTNAYSFLAWAKMEGGLRHWRRAERIVAQGERCGGSAFRPHTSLSVPDSH